MTSTAEQRTARVTALVEQLRSCLPAIVGERPVMLAYLYGSQASGCTTRFSDIDIALVLDPQHGLSPYERLQLDLAVQIDLEIKCGIRNADVHTINDAPLRVQGKVLTQERLLYSRDEDFRVDYEVYTRKMYFDFLPVLKMMEEAYFERAERELTEMGLYGR